MELSQIIRPESANKKTKRIGRGTGSGHGTTSCRGTKGQRARSGYSAKPFWEGGQMPIYRILGKSGFVNIFKKEYYILNLDEIERLGLEKVDLETLKEKKLIANSVERIKVLGRGTLTKSIEVTAHKVSKSATEAIEKINGKVNIIPEKKFLRQRK